jgi:hypothetical protein
MMVDVDIEESSLAHLRDMLDDEHVITLVPEGESPVYAGRFAGAVDVYGVNRA